MSQPEGYLATPLSVTWSLSLRCNFHCRHCYSRGDSSPELGLSAWREVVDRLVAAGVLFASFGGGEPLLVDGLTELIRYGAGKGLSVSLNTNGWLLDARIAQGFREAGVASVGVSLDGASAAVHDNFRDHPGSFVRALAALDHLQQAGVRTTVSTVIHRDDRRTLPELVALVQAHGAAQLFLHNFKCSGEGLANRVDLDLSPAEWRDFYQEALELKAANPGFPVSFDDPIIASLGAAAAHPLVKGSTCGKLSLNIRPNGDLTPCGFLPVVIGNILTDDLETLWHTSPVLAALRNKRPTGKCQGCASYGECLGGCTARSFALSGRFDAPDPHCWVG